MKFEEFRQCIAKTANLELDRVQEQTSLREDLGIDSLQMINLLVELSETFEVEMGRIQNNSDLRTVKSLYRLYGGRDHEQII